MTGVTHRSSDEVSSWIYDFQCSNYKLNPKELIACLFYQEFLQLVITMIDSDTASLFAIGFHSPTYIIRSVVVMLYR